MNSKPILFVDFDRTLFDTEKYYDWLGEPRRERNQELVDGARPLPDCSEFIFSDADDFLVEAQKKFTLVILSFVKLEYSDKQARLQEKKIKSSGVDAHCGGVIVTIGSKANEAKKFLMMRGSYEQKFGFIDDEPKHLSDMKRMNSNSVCIQIKRERKMTGVSLHEKEMSIHPDGVITDLSNAMEVLTPHFW